MATQPDKKAISSTQVFADKFAPFQDSLNRKISANRTLELPCVAGLTLGFILTHALERGQARNRSLGQLVKFGLHDTKIVMIEHANVESPDRIRCW